MKVSKEEMITYTKAKIVKMCIKEKVPYFGLKKVQMVENYLLVKKGEKPKHKDKKKTSKEKLESPHILTERIKKFCYEYSTFQGYKTQKQWAKEYQISSHYLNQVLQWKETQELIEVFRSDMRERVAQKFNQNVEDAIDKLIDVYDNAKSYEIKRKAIVDFLGFAGVKNINVAKVSVLQNANSNSELKVNSLTGRKEIKDMNPEELQKELEELDEML